jgi:transposase InsO family protein
VDLLQLHPASAVPPVRTLQRWLRQAGLITPPAVLVRAIDDRRACEVHEVWQMDAVERLRLADGSGACWLRLTDEYSGAILLSVVFPYYYWAEVPDTLVQQALRTAYSKWGRPKRLRVDNGVPWGSSSGLPSELSLWNAGLGVDTVWNRCRRPQQNGVVERTQGVSRCWVEPAKCSNIEQLRQRLAEEDVGQRERYPAIEGQSRRQAYPGLLHSGRGYAPGMEKYYWDEQAALEFLGRFRVRRKVSKRGQVSLYHRLVEVGRQRGETLVYVQMDASTREWVITDLQQREVVRRPAPQFTREAIMRLAVAKP